VGEKFTADSFHKGALERKLVPDVLLFRQESDGRGGRGGVDRDR